MKKLLLIQIGVLVLTTQLFAQNEMASAYIKEVDHNFHITGCDPSANGYSYASSDKQLSVFSNNDGALIYNKRYNKISDKLSTINSFIPLWEANVFFVFEKNTFGSDQMACIDAKTGNLLWRSEKFQGVEEDNIVYIPELEAFAVTTKANLTMVQARTGEELWQLEKFKGIVGSYFYNKEDNSLTMINMKSSLLSSLFAGLKNQIVRVDVKTGRMLWEQTYRGFEEKKVVTKERLANISVLNGKVFLQLNGIQVYNYETGLPLWSAAYDQTPDVVSRPSTEGKIASYGVYGVVASPVVEGNHIYILDIHTKRSQYIKKYELETGKLIWTSPEIKDAKAIPGMYVQDGKIVLQVGGRVEIQYQYTEIPKISGGSMLALAATVALTRRISVVTSRQVKPMNLQCFDATSGKQVWESEKLKKGITNLIVDNNNLIVCSGKALYSMEINTGKENYEVKLGDDNIGLADMILPYNGKIIVIGEKGLSSHEIKNGNLLAASKYKRAAPLSRNGQMVYNNNLALMTEKSDVAVYNLDDCSYKMYDARKGATSYLSSDGTSLFVLESGGTFSKSKFSKLSTK